MDIRKSHLIVFSPCGGTRRAADAVVNRFPWPTEVHDVTRPDPPFTVAGDELAVFAFPAYGGHPPAISEAVFAMITGTGGPAIVMAVYGNREYDQTLIDLDAYAKKSGFVPVAGVAAVAEHAIFPTVASGRPDADDLLRLANIGDTLVAHLGTLNMDFRRSFRPPGHRIMPKKLPPELFTPSVDQDRCTRCGRCVRVCPTGAIDPAAPNTTYVPQCLWCMACVKTCPETARILRHELIPELREGMEERTVERREAALYR